MGEGNNNRLITVTLYNSIKWLKTCPDSYGEKAYEELKTMLGRTGKWDPNPSVQRGIKFEDTLQNILEAGTQSTIQCSPLFREFLDKCEGGEWQKKTRSVIVIDGINYCMNGKIDVDFPKYMLDVKTTGSNPWKGWDHKFLSTIQHKVYCHNEQKRFFCYMIAYFDDPEDNKDYSKPLAKQIESIHYVNYEVESFEKLEEELRNHIGEILTFLEQYPELEKLYNGPYSKYV